MSAMVNKTSNNAYSGPWYSEGRDMRELRAIWDQSGRSVWRVDSRVIMGSILRSILVNSEKPHEIPENCLHTAVGRALRLNMTKIWVLEAEGWGTGIAPLQPPSHPHHPGYTPPTPPCTGGSGPCSTLSIKWSWGSYPSANSLYASISQGYRVLPRVITLKESVELTTIL